MGDMLKCNRCGTFHYRNDPCVESVLPELPPYCPQCLLDTTFEVLNRNEGYCEACCRDNQARLDAHNAEFDRWDRMTDAQRSEAIRGYSRRAR